MSNKAKFALFALVPVITIVCITLYYCGAFKTKDAKTGERGEYHSADELGVDYTDYSYMDYETPTKTQIDSISLINETQLSDAAIICFPFFLDEYLDEYDDNSLFYSAKYISNSYKEYKGNEWIRVTIAEIPDVYFNCGWSENQQVWVFNKKLLEYLPEDHSHYSYQTYEVDSTDHGYIDDSNSAEDGEVEPVD